MLYLPDINILIYAKMSGMDEHSAACEWLSSTLNDPASSLLVCETTLLSFLRITTNKKAFDPPLPILQAFSFISDLLANKNVRLHRPRAEHFAGVASFMQKHDLGGNLVMDIHLALIANEMGAIVVTRDADFKKISLSQNIKPALVIPWSMANSFSVFAGADG